MIVNANNNGGVWSGDIHYYPSYVLLDPVPYYDDSLEEFGGAVGLVSYHLHRQACTPPHDSTVCAIEPHGANDGKETIIMPHYGPVLDSLPGDSTIPFIVQRRSLLAVCNPICQTPPTVDVSHLFNVLVAPGGSAREVWVYPKTVAEGGEGTLGSLYLYTISLRSVASGHTDLRSAETFVSVAPDIDSDPFSYPYTVRLLCMDFNMSGGVEPGDIGAWVDQPVDVDGDEWADVVDLGLVIDAVVNAP